jgi:hypothetical protein
MEEEFVYLSAPSRLDYFKSGIQYDKKVIDKRKQLVTSEKEVDIPSQANKKPRSNSMDNILSEI